VVRDRNRPEHFQNSLIESTSKAVFLALDLSIKHYRPFPSDLKTDQEVQYYKQGKLLKVFFGDTYSVQLHFLQKCIYGAW